MPLPDLLNVPKSDQDWDIWAFNLRKQNEQTRQAIYTQSNKTTELVEYQLNPINFSKIDVWLAWNQQALDDINKVLQLEGSDLQAVNLSDPEQLNNWIYNVYSQYRNAAVALKI